MTKVYKKILPLVLLVGLLQPANAQNQEDISAFLNAGGKDASKLIEAYLEPTVKSLSYGMTGSWYNTAATHKKFGVDFGVSVNLATIPTAENFFDPTKLKLSSGITYDGARDNDSGGAFDPTRKAPTFFGSKDETQYTATYDPDGSGGPLVPQTMTFRGPEGLGVKDAVGVAGVPVPVVQLGIGIIKNTDLKFRFIPKIDAGGSSLSMFGVGVQHDIKQHIPGIKRLPFDLAALVAYNSLKGEIDLSNDDLGDTRPNSPNGMGIYKFNSMVYQVLISKRLAVVTFYGGVGYSMINTKVNINGTYTIEGSSDDFNITDPVSMTIKNKSMRFTAGMRLKFGPIYLVGDYTVQKYKMFNAGIGFSIRENKNIL